MRWLAIAAVLAACTTEPRRTQLPQPRPAAAQAEARTPEVRFVDTIGGAAVPHVAVGGTLRVRVANAYAAAVVHGPFVVAADAGTFTIRALGEGAGAIEIDTADGTARIAVSAAPIARVSLERGCARSGTIVLRDARGDRLVDASLRVAPGSAPVVFSRAAWDRVEVGDARGVRVKTDLLEYALYTIEPASQSASRSTDDSI